jgi:hypothetical protein
MTGVDTRRYEMLVRVRDFGTTYADRFPPSSLGGQAFATVKAAVDSLSQHAVSLMSGRGSAREGTTSKAVAREALRDGLDAITRTARAMALDSPGIDDKFRPPRGSNDQTLLNAARAFARDAVPLVPQFVAHDMPSDFLEDLDEDIKDFESAIRDREAGKDMNVAARASIETSMEAGLDAIRRLDAVVPNRLRDDGAAVAVWERARRIEYPHSRSRGDAVPAVTSETEKTVTA